MNMDRTLTSRNLWGFTVKGGEVSNFTLAPNTYYLWVFIWGSVCCSRNGFIIPQNSQGILLGEGDWSLWYVTLRRVLCPSAPGCYFIILLCSESLNLSVSESTSQEMNPVSEGIMKRQLPGS